MTAYDLLPRTERGDLTLGHILAATGRDLGEVLVVRHTFRVGTNDMHALSGPADLTDSRVLAYTRRQGMVKFPASPPPFWLVFIADGGLRSRFFGAFENRGEILGERVREASGPVRTFDLRPSVFLEALRQRLVIEWSKDPVNWAKPGVKAAAFAVAEIADPSEVPFPGFDQVLVDFATLIEAVEGSRYRAWQAALGSVQGIYLITDAVSGQQYVGKADGSERILGRWATYARTGHGGNVALARLLGVDPDRRHDFRFSILRVFGPSTPRADVDAAEEHFKRALMTRQFGFNRN